MGNGVFGINGQPAATPAEVGRRPEPEFVMIQYLIMVEKIVVGSLRRYRYAIEGNVRGRGSVCLGNQIEMNRWLMILINVT